jgi:hypothetical protein
LNQIFEAQHTMEGADLACLTAVTAVGFNLTAEITVEPYLLRIYFNVPTSKIVNALK